LLFLKLLQLLLEVVHLLLEHSLFIQSFDIVVHAILGRIQERFTGALHGGNTNTFYPSVVREYPSDP